MKAAVCAAIGLAGAWMAQFFGGWTPALKALLIFMGIDFITGLIAACFNKSPKTEGGGLSSLTSWRGLAKKVVTLMLVAMANQLDTMLEIDYICTATIISFAANEVISIVENASLLGIVKIPAITRAIEILKSKENIESEDKVEDGDQTESLPGR